MTIIFFGSSDFSIPALQACLDAGHKVLLVITTPDQKKGRGLKLSPTVVKTFALEKGLLAEAPENLKDPALLERVKALKPELFVVSSYGKIIPSGWLKVPSKLSLNVHPSLLPKYRGASPVNRPIVNGDSETGVTIMEVAPKLDSGDMFLQKTVPLAASVDAQKLSEFLAQISYDMVKTVFKQIQDGTLKRTPQDEKKVTYADKLSKEDGALSLAKMTAMELSRRIRGLKPWPGGYLIFKKNPLALIEAEALSSQTASKPGTLLEIHRDGSVDIAAREGVLRLKTVKPAGKNEMSAADFVRGQRFAPGFIFEDESL